MKLPPELPPEIVEAARHVPRDGLKNQGLWTIGDDRKLPERRMRAHFKTGALTELRLRSI
jgi:hypothetical protein